MKKTARRMCAFILAAAMMIPLTACKKGKGKNKGSSGPRQDYVKEDDPYYSSKETELKVEIPTRSDKELEYQELYNARIIGDQLMCEYYVSYKMPKDIEDKIYSFDYENGDYTEIEKLYAEYYGNGMVIFDLEGNIIKLIESNGSDGFTKVVPKNGGGFYATRYQLIDDNECRAQVELVTVDENFEVTNSVPLDESVQDIDKIIELDNGNFLFVGYMENYIVGKDGSVINSFAPEDWVLNYFKIDGKIYACFEEYNETTYESQTYIQQIDENTCKFVGDKTKVDYDLWNAVQGEDGIYCSTSEGVKKLDLLKNEEETILEWNWTDVNYMDSFGEDSISVISEDKILLTRMTYEEGTGYGKTIPTTRLFMNVLTREEKNPHAGKRILQIGTLGGVTSEFYEQVIDYNVDPNHDARIQMRFFDNEIEYSGDDYLKSVGEFSDKIYLEMLSGDGPDILMNFSSLCQFDTEDVLVDLNTYIDGDKGLNRADYFDNILNAFESSEKLYHIPVCVNIDGYIGNKDLIGERTGWTYEEFDQIASSLPKDVSMIEETEYASFLQMLLLVSSSYYVDYGTKEVKFEGPDFKKALEISKKYGVEHITDDGMDIGMSHVDIWTDSMMMPQDEADPFEEGLLALRRVYIYGIRNYVSEYQTLKKKSVFVGIPSPNGTGMTASPVLTFAISASSKCKDEAWDFIRFFFEEDQQTKFSINEYSIPLNRKALDAKIDDDIRYYEEEKKFVEENKDMFSELPDEYFYEITPEIKADFLKLVEAVSTSENMDPAIMAIINEDSAAYFAGQKSVDDVAKLIQNRARTKVSER
ncbi:MAG: carbohydrate ABC transporter substrate-binding protein [Clostridiales bacterium]|nr:carbohydrate ABC transporter substrate-binding protein [Clostridiales bacterium]